MIAKLIEGAPLAAQIRDDVARDVQALRLQGRAVRLACIQVGEKAESVLYARNQHRVCVDVGMEFSVAQLPATASQAELLQKIEELNAARDVHGMILQLPLPPSLDAFAAQRAMDPNKDVEGAHPLNLGLLICGQIQRVPCTAMAAYQLIKSTGISLKGLECVIVGRSQIVGKPLALMLIRDHCTVTVCHTSTRDLTAHTRNADLLIAAAGRPALIKAEMVKPGAMVIDVGTNRVRVLDAHGQPALNEKGKPAFKTVGDVDTEPVKTVAEWITPVPGGVGPVTVMILLRNVVEAANSLSKKS
ncbi:MAG: bifunctional 5,10-methylenetetrahydrofolate dehydrogenase/5,10-methenyltetrahydrofolate cyclohydrolase [Planctomycetota bacterium]